MRAFIEYPDAGTGRIEITSEFTVETRAHRYRESLERLVSRAQMTVRAVDAGVAQDRRYWDDRMIAEDTQEDADQRIEDAPEVELEVKIPRYRGDDEYWKDDCL